VNKYKGVMMITRTFKAFSGRTGSVYRLKSLDFRDNWRIKMILPLSGALGDVCDWHGK
jgi:hypothetical protein